VFFQQHQQQQQQQKMSSKLSFRARALDPTKPMPIYFAEELHDLSDYAAINRAVPQMPSGMEKEEESVSGFFWVFSSEKTRFSHVGNWHANAVGWFAMAIFEQNRIFRQRMVGFWCGCDETVRFDGTHRSERAPNGPERDICCRKLRR
jgi:hypothetical protein